MKPDFYVCFPYQLRIYSYQRGPEIDDYGHPQNKELMCDTFSNSKEMFIQVSKLFDKGYSITGSSPEKFFLDKPWQ